MAPLHALACLLLVHRAAAAGAGAFVVGAAACPKLSGQGCAACVAATDSRKSSKWGGQPCVHLSKPVRGDDCQPANWWEGSTHAGITATGNCTGCTKTCSGPTPPAPPSPSPKPKPARCNSELSAVPPPTVSESAHAGAGKTGKLIKLPQPKGDEAIYPAGLDGSPFAFYFVSS